MAGNNQTVQKNKKEETEKMKVEFTVSTEGKEQDLKLQELQKRRATYRANLSYAVQMQDKYAVEYTEAMQAGADLDCTGFAGHVEKTYNEVKGRVRNYEREQISQKV